MREDWKKTTLDCICEKTSNIKWTSHVGKDFEYIDLSSVSRDDLEIVETSTINSSTAPSRAKKIVFQGDIIFATTRPTLKRAVIIDQKHHNQICSTGYCVLRPVKDVALSGFIYYFLLSEDFMERMESLQRGASYPAVSDKDVLQTTLYLPSSLTEQKQIVAILDQAFTAIDQAKANIEKNIENAKELFQSKLNEIFSQKGDGWKEKTLGDICKKSQNIKWQDNTNKEFQYIDLSSVSRESLDVEETQLVNSTNAPSRAKKIVKEGDVIFATTRPTLKRATIINESLSGQICSTGYTVLCPKENISSDWIFFYLFTSKFMDRMETLQRGASYPAVTDNDVKGASLSIPLSKEEEAKNIAVMHRLRMGTTDFSLFYDQKLECLEELKKSILQKAFAGELTQGTVDDELPMAAEPVEKYS